MITINFTQDMISKLQYLRYNHPHPRVQQRVEVLLLKNKELPHKEIARLTDLSVNVTITYYVKLYQQKGLDGIEEINFYQPKSYLFEWQQLRNILNKILGLQLMRLWKKLRK